ncbi:cytochrome c family protein [Erythrobacter sp. HL-111]|uniref:c-type cytochrome n=1 Tax=Erythrobacter sp. HL-111 TaxID=1798193 RepID=UPI0006DA052B|nr:cytochrome c family protein [Erythrobacter sp. HL-111]KPP89457.1 MAG: monoheme cytochrome c2 [Erythrobacteraceae bacterium HL-111]SDS48865.1 cytochrome c [Erythrobacter sp. HL-111]
MAQDNNTNRASGADTVKTESGSSDLFNTAAGWVLFAGVVGLGLSVLSDKYFHGYDPSDLPTERMGYVVEGVEEEGAADAGPTLAQVLADADPEAGAKVFAKCQSCHNVEEGGPNGVGPNLHGVMGKPIAANAPGFNYSGALKEKGGEWTWENMSDWLASPRNFASGTSMSFAGLGSIEDRANVMAYLAENGGAPPKPEPEAPAAEEAAPAEEGGEEQPENGADPAEDGAETAEG